MNITRRGLLKLATAAVVVPGTTFPLSVRRSAAMGFPTRPVTLICPWPPGGSTDVTLRALAEAATKHLGQPVEVQNKPGDSGTAGAATVATVSPDGYTLTQMPFTVFRIPHLTRVTWDPLKDFTYIILTTGYTYGVVVRADSPWKTWHELLAYATANPGKVTYTTTGTGTTPHITMAAIAKEQRITWTHVPMKGEAEMMSALLGGSVAAIANASGWASQVDAGHVRLLCTWGAVRTKRWPHVPTLTELGHGIVSTSPFGFAGPKGMDPNIVEVLHDAFRKALDDPTYLSTLDRYGMESFYKGTKDYVRFAAEAFVVAKQEIELAGLASRS